MYKVEVRRAVLWQLEHAIRKLKKAYQETEGPLQTSYINVSNSIMDKDYVVCITIRMEPKDKYRA